MGRGHHGVGPPEPVVDVGRTPAVVRLGVRGDVPHLPVAVVVPVHPVVISRIDDVRVLGIHRDVTVFAPADGVPVLDADAAEIRADGDGDRRVVLLRGVEPVGRLVVGGHMVHLRRRLIEQTRPRAAAVEAHRAAAVAPVDHPQGIRGVDPQVVVIRVRREHALEGFAAVRRFPEEDVEDEDRVLIAGAGDDVVVVPRTLEEVGVLVHADPRLPRVIGAEDPLLPARRVDDRPQAIGVPWRDGDPDPSLEAGRETGVVGQFGPGVAAVRALEESGAGARAAEAPGEAPQFQERRVQDVGIRGVEDEVDRPRVLVPVQDLLPRRAAIARPVDAACLARAPRVAERGHPGDVGVLRMYAHPGDLERLREPEVPPARAPVVGAVDAVAVRGVAADAGLAHADVDDVGVGAADLDGPDGARAEVAVGDVAPVRPAVLRLPDAAARAALVEDEIVRGVAGHAEHAAAARGSDRAPVEEIEPTIADGLRVCARRRRSTEQRQREQGPYDSGHRSGRILRESSIAAEPRILRSAHAPYSVGGWRVVEDACRRPMCDRCDPEPVRIVCHGDAAPRTGAGADGNRESEFDASENDGQAKRRDELCFRAPLEPAPIGARARRGLARRVGARARRPPRLGLRDDPGESPHRRRLRTLRIYRGAPAGTDH